jgi:hypothetical protein
MTSTAPATTPRASTRPVRPGDVIVFLGAPHLIASVDERTKDGNPIARAADGWGITLWEDGFHRIPCPNDRNGVIEAAR